MGAWFYKAMHPVSAGFQTFISNTDTLHLLSSEFWIFYGKHFSVFRPV